MAENVTAEKENIILEKYEVSCRCGWSETIKGKKTAKSDGLVHWYSHLPRKYKITIKKASD